MSHNLNPQQPSQQQQQPQQQHCSETVPPQYSQYCTPGAPQSNFGQFNSQPPPSAQFGQPQYGALPSSVASYVAPSATNFPQPGPPAPQNSQQPVPSSAQFVSLAGGITTPSARAQTSHPAFADGMSSPPSGQWSQPQDLSVSIKELIENLQLEDATTDGTSLTTKASGQGIYHCLLEIFERSAHIIDPDFCSCGSPLCETDDATGYFDYVAAVIDRKQLLPIIAVMNTSSKGAHWVCVVALHINSGITVYLVDSIFPARELPEDTKRKFTALFPHLKCTFQTLPADAGVQQVEVDNPSDCGWWAIYNAVQIVKYENLSYYKSFASRNPGLMLRKCLDEITDLTVMKDKATRLFADTDASMDWIRSTFPLVNGMRLNADFTKDKKSINALISEHLLVVRSNAIRNRTPWPADVLQKLAHIESFALILDAESLDSSRMLIENGHFQPHEIIVTNPAPEKLVITALRDTHSDESKSLTNIRIVPSMLLNFIEEIPQKGPIFHFVYLDYVQTWGGQKSTKGCQPVKEVEKLFEDHRFMPNSLLSLTVTSLATRFSNLDCIFAPASVIAFGQKNGYSVYNIHNKYFKSHSEGSSATAAQMLLMQFVVYLPTPFMSLQKLEPVDFVDLDVLKSKDCEIEHLKGLLSKFNLKSNPQQEHVTIKEEESGSSTSSLKKTPSSTQSSGAKEYRMHEILKKPVRMFGNKLGTGRKSTHLRFYDTRDTETLPDVLVETFLSWPLCSTLK